MKELVAQLDIPVEFAMLEEPKAVMLHGRLRIQRGGAHFAASTPSSRHW